MCEPATVAYGAMAVAALFGANQSKKAADAARGNQPQLPSAPPQESKAPDTGAIRRAAAARVGAGQASSTLLTGPGGVAPSALSLGYNTLLGS